MINTNVNQFNNTDKAKGHLADNIYEADIEISEIQVRNANSTAS